MALQLQTPIVIGRLSFNYLHLTTMNVRAPESNKSPFVLEASFRAYLLHYDEQGEPLLDENGEKVKGFAPLDKHGSRIIVVVNDIESLIMTLLAGGDITGAQQIGGGMVAVEGVLAKLIQIQHGVTVEVV